MASFNKKKITAFFEEADSLARSSPRDSDRIGAIFEGITSHLFGSIPGMIVSETNVVDVEKKEEIDIVLYNDCDIPPFKKIKQIIFVECKYWSKRVGAPEVELFIAKLRKRRLDFGLLVAANGITGKASPPTSAYASICDALKEGIKVIVIDRKDIEKMKSANDVCKLVLDKYLKLYCHGTAF